MFDTGSFSRMARVSKRTLRYYDSIDLLKPIETDPQTGTRFYSAEQFADLNRIVALKELGISLAQIRQILDDEVSHEEIIGMLLLRRAEAEEALESETRRLRSIEARLREPEQFLTSAGVVVKSVANETILSVRKVLTMHDAMEVVGPVMVEVPKALGPDAVSHFASVMHWDSFDEERMDVEVGYYLNDEAPSELVIGELVLAPRELPAGEMATVVVVGGPAHYPAGFNAAGRWAEANGVGLGTPQREIFLDVPDGDIDAAVIELQFPVLL